MLELRNVDSFYGGSHILHDISLRVAQGEILTVLGRNGMGKTTLLKTIMGLTDKMSGSLALNGRELSSLPTHVRARAGIGYVPQGREILPDFTVQENILMGLYARPGRSARIPDVIFDLFPILREFLRRPGGMLSGGQQQQLAIARALMAEPRLMLLDEPTEGIQPNVVEQIQATIKRLQRELGLTVILIEQNVAFARAAAETFAILQKGAIAAAGDIRELSDVLIHKYMTV